MKPCCHNRLTEMDLFSEKLALRRERNISRRADEIIDYLKDKIDDQATGVATVEVWNSTPELEALVQLRVGRLKIDDQATGVATVEVRNSTPELEALVKLIVGPLTIKPPELGRNTCSIYIIEW